MGRHTTALITESWPYKCTQGAVHRGGDLDRSLRCAGPVARYGSVAGLPVCAGSRLRPSAVGYLRLWPTDPPGCAGTLTDRLRVFAHRRGRR
jgi:hypothetical protein